MAFYGCMDVFVYLCVVRGFVRERNRVCICVSVCSSFHVGLRAIVFSCMCVWV